VRIAYLILAHAGLSHLDRLIAALNDTGSMFVVHVDSYSLQNYVSPLPNVTVLRERTHVNWGGYSQTRAELALLRRAVQTPADYYVLISGTHYPIRPNQFLYDQLAGGDEFLSARPVPTEDKPLSRFEHYYFDFDRRTRSVSHYALRGAEAALRLLGVKKPIPFALYAGSNWFALTHAAVAYIFDTLDRDPRYAGFFRTSLFPEEAIFQTILGNSPWRPRLRHCLTYSDWSTVPGPAIIGDRHLDELYRQDTFTSDYGEFKPFFARKFDPHNTRVLDIVDRRLRK